MLGIRTINKGSNGACPSVVCNSVEHTTGKLEILGNNKVKLEYIKCDDKAWPVLKDKAWLLRNLSLN